MGYTNYYYQKRDFTLEEWSKIVAETKRIIAKAESGLYSGEETKDSNETVDLQGKRVLFKGVPVVNNKGEKVADDVAVQFRDGFNNKGAWRTFPHPDMDIPHKGKKILLAGWDGTKRPTVTKNRISLNGKAPEDYETFTLCRKKGKPQDFLTSPKEDEYFAFCKTEYRPYDAVVVSILDVARKVAPDAIRVSSDGGDEAIRYMF